MIRVEPYNPRHLEDLVLQDSQKGEKPLSLKEASTILHEETVLGIVGGFSFSPGVIHLWALFSEEIRNYPMSFQKLVSDMIRFVYARHNPRRIQMDVRVDFERGQRWAESLGFSREGVMKKFASDGSDCYLYAKVVS